MIKAMKTQTELLYKSSNKYLISDRIFQSFNETDKKDGIYKSIPA